MKRGFDWRYVAGTTLLVALAAIILGVLSLMSRAGEEDISLADSSNERHGWSYELLADNCVQTYEPAFEDDRYMPVLPENAQAVRIRRTMTEEIAGAELEWISYFNGVEVFLNGKLLYTDFPQAQREADGFLRLDREEWNQIDWKRGDTTRRMRMTLPANYLGGELCVITYFPKEWEDLSPVYPYIGNEDSFIAPIVALSLNSNVIMIVYALLALLIAGMYLLDISNDDADAKSLLLCVYFLLLFLDTAYFSLTGYYSKLNAHIYLSVLQGLGVAPLYFYLALRLKKRWRYPLCGMVVLWALYEGIQAFLEIRRGLIGTAESVGPESLVILLVVAVAFCVDSVKQVAQSWRGKKRLRAYGIIVAVVVCVHIINKIHVWGGVREYLLYGIWEALRRGNFEPIVSLVTSLVTTVVLIAVVMEFVRRMLRTRQEMSVLQERARQTMEGYKRMLVKENATNALHHEMRHHMVALSGILKSGDVERAVRYADAVAGDLDRLPAGRYSQNTLVDVIAGSFLDRAWTRQIRVEHRLNVPPELNIADEDLSVFLSNMLQNALEACERMDDSAKRRILVEMRLRGKFLFIHCVNSAPDEPADRENRPGHGYGLAAMRGIAEKYNSTLVIERTAGEFSVKSDLCLRAG